MRKRGAIFSLYLLITLVAFSTSGCTLIFQKGRRKDIERINELKSENQRLQDELSDLERAKAELEDRFKKEIGDKQVSVEMADRGLVVTFVSEVLFDSGKDVLRSEALEKLDKVASVLNTTVRDLNVGIEGHTDNVPIKHSGWKSNWELSCHRALSVVHYLIDEQGLTPQRLSATGYGEFHPVDSNDSPDGRQRNRRVEIVILPKTVKEKAIQKGESESLK
jgi:chemotaxis protein MotB